MVADAAAKLPNDDQAEAAGEVEETAASEEVSEEPKTEAIPDDVRGDLIQVGKDLSVAESEVTQCKAATKEANATYDSLVLTARSLIAELDGDADRPILAACGVMGEEDNPAVDPDAWRSESIVELGLWAGVVKTLGACGVETIGQLEDLRSEIALSNATWPTGIGPAKITQIEEAVLDRLHAYRQGLAADTGDETDDGEEGETQ
jgi:hypothetical protein